MSQPKRWSHGLTGMSRNRSGPWVTWDDYAALAADRTKWINLSVEHEKEVAELQGKIAALAAENERLRQHRYTPQEIDSIRADIDKLQAEFNRNLFKKVCAENERLRKAGDEMMEVLESEIPFTAMNAVNGWLAAKEGGDAK